MNELPKNLDDCFSMLESELCSGDLECIVEMKQEDLLRFHHNLGRWIRNNYKLWEEGPLTSYFNDMGIHHPDDMSGIIIESFWHHLREEPLELERQIKEYQDFWKKPENQ